MTGLPIIGQEGAAPPPPPDVQWYFELPPRLSATQITMFKRCPEQFRQRYVLKRKERPGGALVLGGAFHKAAELNYRQKIVTREDIAATDMQERFADAFEAEIDQRGGNSEIKWDGAPGKEKDKGAEMVKLYREVQTQHVQPIAVEQQFDILLPGSPVVIEARLDIEEDAMIRDMKTANKKPQGDEIKPDWKMQDWIYKFAVAKPSSWEVVTKTKTPVVYSPEQGQLAYCIPFTPEMAGIMKASVMRTIVAMSETMAKYGPDSPWPDALTHPWACGFCGFKPNCPWWGNA